MFCEIAIVLLNRSPLHKLALRYNLTLNLTKVMIKISLEGNFTKFFIKVKMVEFIVRQVFIEYFHREK